jgi:hypothetical protein
MAKITDFINGKVTYDREGQYFWVHGHSNGIQMLGELRGWGHIQNMKQFKMAGQPQGSIDMDAAGKFQDEIGEFVAAAINEKIEREGKV